MGRRADGTNENLKVITINVQKDMLKLMDKIVELGVHASRCECFRAMMSEWLPAKLASQDTLVKIKQRLKELQEVTKKLPETVDPCKVIEIPVPKEDRLVSEEIIDQDGHRIRLRQFETVEASFVDKACDAEGFIRVPQRKFGHQRVVDKQLVNG